MFGCHIHFVVCSCVASMKYLFEYMHKGNDFISVEASIKCNVLNYDEIDWDCRFVNSDEAAWKLLTFPLNGRSYSVSTLPGPLGHEDNDADVVQVVGNSKTNKVASVKLTVVRD